MATLIEDANNFIREKYRHFTDIRELRDNAHLFAEPSCLQELNRCEERVYRACRRANAIRYAFFAGEINEQEGRHRLNDTKILAGGLKENIKDLYNFLPEVNVE